MVVIAIIAILAAILFPVFARARENARRASCSSNLKQIGLGIMQYTQDYDEKFPLWSGGAAIATVTPSNPYGWSDAIQPYLKSSQIFQCPSESTSAAVGAVGSPFAGQPAPTGDGYTDYNYNARLSVDDDGNLNPGGGSSLASLTQATLTVMNYDDDTFDSRNIGWGRSHFSPTSGQPTGLAFTSIAAATRHVKWFSAVGTGPYFSRVYNSVTPGTASLNNPTFNPSP